MPTASTIRQQVEAVLADRIPSALTPVARMIRPVSATGIAGLDEALQGGLPVGAVSELVGPECSGRTAIALSLLAGMTGAGKVCAWIDVSDTLDPESAAAAGVDLQRLLWVRCGVRQERSGRESYKFALPEKYLVPPQVKKGLYGGGWGPHPRGEAKGLPEAVGGLLQGTAIEPRCAEAQRRERPRREVFEPSQASSPARVRPISRVRKPWPRMEQGLRATDLLLQGGGFSAIVLDMGSVEPEAVSRVPLATWFRYRAAAERSRTSIVLLTQHACAKSSAELVLRLRGGLALREEPTVFCGMEPRVEVIRRRFTELASKVVPMRKPPRSEFMAAWESRATWAGRR